jgi:hypothetical protein
MTSEISRPIPDTDSLLTPEDVAGRLKVTAEQVRSLIRRNQLAAINVGAGKKRPLYRITPQALNDFFSRRYQPGPAIRSARIMRLPPVEDHFPQLR